MGKVKTKRLVSEKVKNERLIRKRERERKYREMKRQDPVLNELQKKKEAERYKLRKSQGKIKKIGDMSTREVRHQRQKWKKNTKKYREKICRQEQFEIDLQNNSPPDTPDQTHTPSPSNMSNKSSTPSTSRQSCGRKKIRRDRARCVLKLKKTELQLSKALQKVEKYKKKFYRELQKAKKTETVNSSPSPRTKVRLMIRGQNISPNVVKALFEGETLKSTVSVHIKSAEGNTEKHALRKILSAGKLFKKYRLQSAARLMFKKNILRCQMQEKENPSMNNKRKGALTMDMRQRVIAYLEQDDNTKLCPGKKDCVTKDKEKKQKRMLTDTLFNLHSKFLARNADVTLSYTSFTRAKPFWVVHPKVTGRDTCLCRKHENFKMIVDKLHFIKVIEEKNLSEVIKAYTCSIEHDTCFLRTCEDCKDNTVTFNANLNIEQDTTYKKWVLQKEERKKGNKAFTVVRNVKDAISCSVGELIGHLQESVPAFLHHVLNIKHQFGSLDMLKNKVSEEEAIIHVDFSENYCCKYAEETQAVHFGASRQQVTMHTGVLYLSDEKPQCFCTLSESLRHDPSAIWAHLTPILTALSNDKPAVTTLHFVSDSPATQYRNKTMFNMIATFLPSIFPNLKKASWNYSEAGHGKGPADGVGGVLKRTADRIVAQGQDVHNYATLLEKLQTSINRVKLYSISEECISGMDKNLPVNAKAITATMKVHQVTWDAAKPRQISLRSLSCFRCPYGEQCTTYGTLGLWNVDAQSKVRHGGTNTEIIGPNPNETNVDELNKTDQDGVKVGDCVAVIYDNDWYPGIVEKSERELLTINFMKGSGIQKNSFSWPNVPDRQKVKGFHSRQWNAYSNHSHRHSNPQHGHIPFPVVFKNVAEYIRQNRFGSDVYPYLPMIARHVFRDEARASDLEISLRSYSTQACEQRIEESHSNWSKILAKAQSMHISGIVTSLYTVLLGVPFETCTALEDFRMNDLGAAATILRLLRERMYGILMKEKPGGPGVVPEWCVVGTDSEDWQFYVRPFPPPQELHPGLLALWGEPDGEGQAEPEDIVDIRWRLFAHTVSPSLDVGELRGLVGEGLSHLVVPTVILKYLREALPAQPSDACPQYLADWELEALAIQAVLLASTDPKKVIVPMPYDARGVRIATVFMRGVSQTLMLLATCGFPIPMKDAMPWLFFDGKLFHQKYLGMRNEKHIESLCVNQDGNSMMQDFLKVKKIALESLQ